MTVDLFLMDRARINPFGFRFGTVNEIPNIGPIPGLVRRSLSQPEVRNQNNNNDDTLAQVPEAFLWDGIHENINRPPRAVLPSGAAPTFEQNFQNGGGLRSQRTPTQNGVIRGSVTRGRGQYRGHGQYRGQPQVRSRGRGGCNTLTTLLQELIRGN